MDALALRIAPAIAHPAARRMGIRSMSVGVGKVAIHLGIDRLIAQDKSRIRPLYACIHRHPENVSVLTKSLVYSRQRWALGRYVHSVGVDVLTNPAPRKGRYVLRFNHCA